MVKGLVVVNIIALLLTFVSSAWVYTTHADISSTKNEHLHRQNIKEINSETKIESVKASYIESLKSNKKVREAHNKELMKSLYINLGIFVLLALSLVALVILNRRQSNAT